MELKSLKDTQKISKKISNSDFLNKRNIAVRKFIFYIFELVKNDYLSNRGNIISDLTPILFGSYGIKKATNFSDLDIFFVPSRKLITRAAGPPITGSVTGKKSTS